MKRRMQHPEQLCGESGKQASVEHSVQLSAHPELGMVALAMLWAVTFMTQNAAKPFGAESQSVI